jgi:beta-glucosidase-like glycosyl hydrolase
MSKMLSSRPSYKSVPTDDKPREHEAIPLKLKIDGRYDDGADDEGFYSDELDEHYGAESQSKPRTPQNGPASRRRRWNPCRRLSRTCVAISVLAFGAFATTIVFGGLYAYRTAPPDGQSPPWYPAPNGGTVTAWESSYKKAKLMVEKMTLAEKVNVTTGTGWSMQMCVGNTAPALNAGFPALCLQDGPLGIRFADHATAFPAALTVGATWNRDLMRARGVAHGAEAKGKGVNVLLGPAMGPLGRNPAGGRNWEGFASDPVLQAVAASETIRGIQSQGVIATAKHFVANEQEHFRRGREWGLPNALSANIDDRTMHEVYAWPFAESVRAGVGSIMCSYQMVNNSYACGNSKLINGILKDEYGFQGFIQLDWLAQRGGVSTALAGLDMSMPGDGKIAWDGISFWGKELSLAILNGSIPIERLDDMTTRVVAAWYQMGQDSWKMKGPNFSSWTNEKIGKLHHGAANSDDTTVVNHFVNVQANHSIVARQVAAEGVVLVKNKGNFLPLSRSGRAAGNSKYRVAIIGEDAGPGAGPNACEDRACNQGTLAVGWGSGASEFPYLKDPWSSIRKAFNKDVEVSYNPQNVLKPEQKAEMRTQDLCIVFANSDSGEGYLSWNGIRGDRNNLYLDKGGDTLIKSVAENCGGGKGDTVVVIHAVGPVNVESWADLLGVKAILLAHLPGQESGDALVDVLFGDVDASGRLPYTLGKSLDDYGPGAQVLYYPNGLAPQVDFKETLYVDYRHFDKFQITPRYEFGFGLSYTTFAFSDLSINSLKAKSAFPAPRPAGLTSPTYSTDIPDPSSMLFPSGIRKLTKYVYPYIDSVSEVKKGAYPYPAGYETPRNASQAGGAEGGNPDLFTLHVAVSVKVTNTGSRAGKEVVQLYVGFPDNVHDPTSGERVDSPVRVLRNFEKIELESGNSTIVTMNLTRKDLSYWSIWQQNWVMPTSGEFKIWVGKSSRNLSLMGTY